MSKNDNIDDLITAGLIAVAGLGGLYLVCKAFDCFKKGDEVNEEDLREASYTNREAGYMNYGYNDHNKKNNSGFGACDRCGKPAIGICSWCNLPICRDCAYNPENVEALLHSNCND